MQKIIIALLNSWLNLHPPCTGIIGQQEAEDTTRLLSAKEGIFCGISSGGAVAAALRLSQEVENAVIVAIICDRGDRYLSTGVFPA